MQRFGPLVAAMSAVVLAASCASNGDAVGTSPSVVTVADNPVSASSTVTSPASTATTAAAPASSLQEIDLETNVTVFFDPVAVTDAAQAEASILEVIGDVAVESVTILDRNEAWAQATALAAQAPTPVALDSSQQDSLGEVARVIVLDREARNRLTDDIEDSSDVVGIVYVVGLRPTQAIDAFRPLWDIWQILGLFWEPTL